MPKLQGATAVLVYGVIDSPLAQPRNVLFGHFIGALVGVCIAKLFGLLPTEERYEELAWLAASLACATSIVLMQMTKTVHPPAGKLPMKFHVHIELTSLRCNCFPTGSRHSA